MILQRISIGREGAAHSVWGAFAVALSAHNALDVFALMHKLNGMNVQKFGLP